MANNPLRYIDPSGHRYLSAQLAELEFVIDHAMELTSKSDPEYWATRQYLGVKFQPIFNDNNNNQFKYLFGQLTQTSPYPNSSDNAMNAKNQLLDAYDQWQYGPLMAAAAGSMGAVGGGSKGTGIAVHGNSLKSTKPTDVYVVREVKTGKVMRYGETTQGHKVRGQQHARRFFNLGIEVETMLLKGGLSKTNAKVLETRYIKTHEKVFGKKPPYNKSYH
ncbi:hypothetical protein [Paenibacillus sp. 481]|uniref:hypothetical protein n=1 Tax=Paenibacillus sp. 481 TaxID=2835869 RepID=UPI001E4E083C|nr:hypothetical protein [Paenibacillus sp. 481]UHA74900.1 hypothetical protein KIK04_07625 [Paenibacillus sp. 481]